MTYHRHVLPSLRGVRTWWSAQLTTCWCLDPWDLCSKAGLPCCFLLLFLLPYQLAPHPYLFLLPYLFPLPYLSPFPCRCWLLPACIKVNITHNDRMVIALTDLTMWWGIYLSRHLCKIFTKEWVCFKCYKDPSFNVFRYHGNVDCGLLYWLT